jgi:hypothetical protein
VIKTKKVWWAEVVESRREKGNGYLVLVLKLRERDELEDLEVCGRIILKVILRN